MRLGRNEGGANPSGSLVEDLIAEEILRNPEQLATSFMNAPNVGVAICDLQFRFRGINDALAAMNGIPAAAHFGQSIHDVLGEVAGKIEPLFRHVLATGEPIVNDPAGISAMPAGELKAMSRLVLMALAVGIWT